MKRFGYFLSLAALGFAALAPGQTVDGNCADLGAALTTQSEPSSFGTSMRVDSIHLVTTPTNIFIGVAGDSSFNNHIMLLMDFSAATGDASPVPAPGGGAGSLSGGDFVGCTLDLAQLDFGLTINSGDNNGAGAFGSFLDAVDWTSGGNTAAFLGSDAVSGTVADTSMTTSSTWTTSFGAGTIDFAYSDGNNDGVGGNLQGVEYRIPRSLVGATSGTVQLFAALTGGSGFFSSNVLPPVPGQGATNIGVDPNFTSLAGTQATTAAAVPVELSALSLE